MTTDTAVAVAITALCIMALAVVLMLVAAWALRPKKDDTND